MLFNSHEFALFFPLVTVAYFLMPHRARWVVLLTSSCLFYAAFIPRFLFVMAYLILVDYVAGRAIEAASGPRRRIFLLASLIANLGTLFFFKYFNFFREGVAWLAHLLHWNYSLETLSILLPIGLSFHTFQSIAYTIEVYRRRQPAERHLGIYALYVMFYPQLVAGPIERPQRLLPQLRRFHPFRWSMLRSGLLLMAWGYFKKMAIADRIAPIVASAFDAGINTPGQWHGLQYLFAAYLFAFQIYGDFSGYSDIARGTARVMGIRLSKNFDLPFRSRSIAEFWSRWHISLSSWFKDYLYLPLALSATNRPWLAILYLPLVFILSGLWHGANWTFLAWGSLHGTYSLTEHFSRPVFERAGAALERFAGATARRAVAAFIVFNLVAIAWVLFRARSMGDAEHILGSILTWPKPDLGERLPAGLDLAQLLGIAAMVGAMMLFEHSGGFTGLQARLRGRPRWLAWPVLMAMVWAIVILASSASMQTGPFIYFQF